MDLRTQITTSTATRQVDLALAPGDLFVRDGQVVVVLLAAHGGLEWLLADGSVERGDEQTFKGRALTPVDLGRVEGDFLGSLWQLASSREIPGQIRARAVQAAATRAGTEAEGQAARRWASRLFGGMEPVR